MNLTIREGVNKNSIVLKHKIALETITLLESKDLVLETEIELYAMVSTVDNFIEENLIEVVGGDSRNFATIVETDIEPKFNEIIEKFDFQHTYMEILDSCINYIEAREYKDNTFIGLIDTLIDVVQGQNWEDLKFFFNDVVLKAKEAIAQTPTTETPKNTGAKKILAKQEMEGASDKMAALIEKFQREGQEIKQSQEKQEEIKVEENHE
jgi:hypothetical protein